MIQIDKADITASKHIKGFGMAWLNNDTRYTRFEGALGTPV